MSEWSAVVTAGGFASQRLQKVIGTYNKSLARLGGKTLLDRSLDAIKSSGIKRVAVVGDQQVRAIASAHELNPIVADRGSSPVMSAMSGVNALSPEGPILFVPADAPFMTGEHIRDCCSRIGTHTSRVDQWLCVGVCSREQVEFELPRAPFKYVKLAEGEFATSSLYAATFGAVRRATDILDQLSKDRKSQFAIARRFGFGNLLRFFFGKLSMADVEQIASQTFGARGFLVPEVHPMTTFDIDSVQDWMYALSYETTA